MPNAYTSLHRTIPMKNGKLMRACIVMPRATEAQAQAVAAHLNRLKRDTPQERSRYAVLTIYPSSTLRVVHL